MKTKQRSFHFFTVILLVGAFHLQAADSTNTTTVVQESWETISNRWGSVPIEKIKQAAETNEVTAQYYLANAYSDGIGVTNNETEAFKWMKLAAQQGMARAQRNLGWKLQNGLGVETNLDEAAAWYQKAAEQGDASAQFNLGWMNENGEGVTNNLSEAHDLFLQAAAGHQPDATLRVGQMYEKGDGVPQDDHRAMEFYCNKIYSMNYPAKYPNGYVEYGPFGDGAAESSLRLWSQGRGFQNDKDKAEPGYHESAYFIGCFVNLIKTTNAQFYAGEIYYQGKLVPQDLVEAAAWFRLAANQGSDDARKTLDELEPKLLPAQKEAAKKRFDDFKKRLEQVKMNDETLEKAKALKTW